jgi:hypothetical protein
MSKYGETTWTDCTSTWKPAKPKEMVGLLTYKLNHTPKIRFLKRFNLKRNIHFWERMM